MAQKTHPVGFRVGITNNWSSIWYANSKNYASAILMDLQIRKYIEKSLKIAQISKIDIERSFNNFKVILHVGKPGIVIGRGGSGIDSLRKKIVSITGGTVELEVLEVKDADTHASLVAQSIAYSIEKRKPYKRVVNMAIERSMSRGVKGVKVKVSGRLGGGEIARSETYKDGSIPLSTLTADIDYALAEAVTENGLLGVKVWIYKGLK